jgi:hypothetical protein
MELVVSLIVLRKLDFQFQMSHMFLDKERLAEGETGYAILFG